MSAERVSYTTQIILDAVAYPENTQKDVAARYAWGLVYADVNWKTVNEAIIERWSKSGLGRIKELAWLHTEATQQETRPRADLWLTRKLDKEAGE